MTDLTPDQLRRAAVAAGLEQEPDEDGHSRWVLPDDEWILPPDHPALPSYIADLLVARVRETMGARSPNNRETGLFDGIWSTSSQRIRAAFFVLTGEEL